MSTNFLDIQMEKRQSGWPYLVGGLTLVVMVGAAWVWFGEVPVPHHNRSAVVIAPVQEVVEVPELSERVGGDVTIKPPAYIPRELPELAGVLPDIDEFSADSIIVKDDETGKVLFGKEEYVPHAIASITKLMSTLTLMEYGLAWEDTVSVMDEDVIDPHMHAGQQYSTEQLWRASLVGSSNKAVLSLVDSLGVTREEFVGRMNEKALELGMTDTRFVEPTGLDPENVSTPSDLALLVDEALSVNEISQTLLQEELTIKTLDTQKTHHMWNTNWLIIGWIPSKISLPLGGKTGYIPEAGYNFTAKLEDDAGHVLTVVTLGTNSHEARFTETRDIATAVFEAYRWPDEEQLEDESAGDEQYDKEHTQPEIVL